MTEVYLEGNCKVCCRSNYTDDITWRSTQEEKFRICKRPCNDLFIIQTPIKYQTISKPFPNQRLDLRWLSPALPNLWLLLVYMYIHFSKPTVMIYFFFSMRECFSFRVCLQAFFAFIFYFCKSFSYLQSPLPTPSERIWSVLRSSISQLVQYQSLFP